jgi:hypothetical protein
VKKLMWMSLMFEWGWDTSRPRKSRKLIETARDGRYWPLSILRWSFLIHGVAPFSSGEQPLLVQALPGIMETFIADC